MQKDRIKMKSMIESFTISTNARYKRSFCLYIYIPLMFEFEGQKFLTFGGNIRTQM